MFYPLIAIQTKVSLEELNRGSYMSAHVLYEFIKRVGEKRWIKCEACCAFYLFCCTVFNKFNNTKARMLDYIYHEGLDGGSGIHYSLKI